MTNIANQGVMNTTPVGSTYRGLGSSWFNAENVAKEDFLRAEQAQNNQLSRDLYLQEVANRFNYEEGYRTREFNAREAQKQRDYDEYMSNTQYQRAVEDMKKAGINPVLAVQHGASWSGGSSATSSPAYSSSSRSSTSNRGYSNTDGMSDILGGVVKIVAGLLTKNVHYIK